MADVVGWFISLPRWESVAVTAVAVGLLVALYLLRTLPRAATWWPVPVTSTSVGERVTVTGTARASDGATTSPITNDRCLVYRNAVQSDRFNPHDDLESENTHEDFDDRYQHGVAFTLEDETGCIRVDPGGMGLYGEPIETGDGDLAAAKHFASNRGDSFAQNPDLKHEDVSVRLRARQLEPGETATVTGIVEVRDGERVVVASDGLVGFTGSVASGTRNGYVAYLFRRAFVWGAGAAVAVVLTVVGLGIAAGLGR
jgi:hypothetical protein